MASLPVTAKGRITLGRDLLGHLGVEPGARIDCEKRPGGELRLRAAPTGMIDDFLHVFDGKLMSTRPLTIADMNDIAAAGWAGNFGDQ